MSLFGSQFLLRRHWRLAPIVAIWVMTGCGGEDYERRLNETKKYYAYLEMIEANLAPKWADTQRIVEYIRVPKQFQPIPAPVPEKDEQGNPVKDQDGNVVMPAVDPRQPDFLNLLFPANALVGAWEAPFDIVLPDGNSESRKGYIYVLSNYWMFTTEEAANAPTFTGAMIQLIGDALEERLPQDKLENPETKKFPKPGEYLPPNLYSEFDFKSKPITLRETTVPYGFTVYARMNGNIQCLVVVALPDNISSREKLAERIPLMLGNFAFTRIEPKPGQNANAPAQNAQPAAGF